MIMVLISAIEDEGDRTLAEEIYLTYRQNIFRIAMSFLKNETKAEDAVCDVIERVCKNISQFRGLDCNKTRSLIVVYSRNVCRNLLRRDKIIVFDELDEALTQEREETELLVLEQDSYDRIYALVQTLESKYADVLKMKFFLEMEHKEIAKALNISEGNVRARLMRGRAMIREQLIKEGEAL